MTVMVFMFFADDAFISSARVCVCVLHKEHESNAT